MKKLLLIAALFVSTVNAADWTACSDSDLDPTRVGQLNMQLITDINGECMISLGDGVNYPKYRSYMFSTAGDLIVFNSFGDGSPSTSTGARSYILFPRTNPLEFKIEDNNIHVKTPSGVVFVFSGKKGDLVAVHGMYFTLDDEVRGDNNGGLDLHPFKGLIIDEGWRQGELPRVDFKRSSHFKDGHGNFCKVLNSDIFEAIIDNSGAIDGAKLKFVSPGDMRYFLENKCPQIKY
jgi:hypothetical protein